MLGRGACISTTGKRLLALGAVSLLVTACASVDVEPTPAQQSEAVPAVSENESANKTVASQTNDEVVLAKAENEAAAKVNEAEPAPEVNAPAVAETPVVKQAAQEPPKVAAEPVASKAPEQVSEAKAEQQADALVASLAAKDEYEVIAAPAENSAQSNTKARAKLMQKALKVGLKDLPVSIDMWSLKKNPQEGVLELVTPTWQMGQGDYLSQVWLTLKDNALMINSSSEIDQSLKGTGIKVNDGELIPFDRVDDQRIAVLEGDWMSKLAEGGKLDVFMGFFPSKKGSQLFSSDANLDPLSRLVPTYLNLK